MSYAPMAMMGISAVSGLVQSSQAGKSASAAQAAARTNFDAQSAEYTREQGQIDQQAAQQKGDRAMQADRDASTLQVLMGERGASANAQSRSVQELGYFEGMDINRIETNRQNHLASIESQRGAA